MNMKVAIPSRLEAIATRVEAIDSRLVLNYTEALNHCEGPQN